MVIFKDWIFTLFPLRFKRDDTYKDANDKGLLERFMESFGDEIDNEIIPYIENYLDIFDALNVSDELLGHLADTLGNPPDTLGYPDKYRLLLKYLVSLNKLKGTIPAYELLFKIFGVNIVIDEFEIDKHFYDTGEYYDDGSILYDTNCPICSGYEIQISDPYNNFPLFATIDSYPDLLENLIKLVKYVEPINAQWLSMTYNGSPVSLPGAYSVAYSFGYEVIN